MTAAQPATLAETPDRHGAFPRLTKEQIEALLPRGERRPVAPGDVLFREGEEGDDLFVILEGQVAIVEGYGRPDERVLSVHGPGRFLGELNLLTGQASFVTAVATEPGEVLALPADTVRDIAADDERFGDLLLRACMIRRSLLIGLGAGLRIIGSRYSPDTRRLRDFAARNRIPHVWTDLEDDPTADAVLRELGVGPEETPLVIWGGKRLLRNPSNAELGRLIGLRASPPRGAVVDLLVVGAGPAGLAASVYGASDGLETLVLDAVATGGQAGTSSHIENYLGFPEGISGAELADRALIQATKFGARLSVPAEALSLEQRGDHHVVRVDGGEELEGRTVVIATGVRYRKLPVPRFEEFERASIFYAATPMEALFCRGDRVVVVGGGNSAGQATLFLSRYATRVKLVVRERELTEHMSRYLADRIARRQNVHVMLESEVRELLGDNELERVVVENNRTGKRTTLDARALFVFIGADPCNGWLGAEIALDEGGYVLTGAAAGSDLALQTSRPGVFAAGDVRSGSARRVAAAVGEGAMAVRLVHEHLHMSYAASA
ncbi:MAG TPA: FAD-dependent oxidoreductase [Thermoleophilaceae bacterium]|nr:FAD-dependent oxidoreductase [Thermoleophilaceae bacterium]